jgi:hypothetical protein
LGKTRESLSRGIQRIRMKNIPTPIPAPQPPQPPPGGALDVPLLVA